MERACGTLPPDATRGVDVLLENAARELRARAAAADGGGWRRWTIEIGGAPPPAEWVCAVGARPRALFESRDNRGAWAGAGSAIVFRGADARRRVARALRELPQGSAFFGVERFDPAGGMAGGAWAGFGPAVYFLPRWELARCEGVCTLSLVARPGEDVPWPESRPAPAPLAVPPPASQRPDRSGWIAAVEGVRREITAGGLHKVVLARESRHEMGSGLPRAWLAGGGSPCFRFLFEPEGGGGIFLGLSPELLFRRSGREVESEAVAGTRPLGAGEERSRVARELASSRKDLGEFELVARVVDASLRPLCRNFEAQKEPSILPAGPVIHLRKTFRGRLLENVDDARLLEALHPTPATCGAPVQTALEILRRLEPFDRGCYAGPVGRISKDSAEFAVAIRSALLWRGAAWLYAGAGIVGASRAEAEWEELNRKAAVFLGEG